MSTMGWSGSGRLAERMSWWLMGCAARGEGEPRILPEPGALRELRRQEDGDAVEHRGFAQHIAVPEAVGGHELALQDARDTFAVFERDHGVAAVVDDEGGAA